MGSAQEADGNVSPNGRRGSSFLNKQPALILSPSVLDFAHELVCCF